MHAAEGFAHGRKHGGHVVGQFALGVGAVDHLDVEPEALGSLSGERLSGGEPVAGVDVRDSDRRHRRILAQMLTRQIGNRSGDPGRARGIGGSGDGDIDDRHG
ncbi:hypothetical protein D3C72_2305260 [compost metagenome]